MAGSGVYHFSEVFENGSISKNCLLVVPAFLQKNASIMINTIHHLENMRAKVEWVDNLTFIASDDSGHYVILDHNEDKALQKGSSPTNMLLQAMCGCTAMDVISILQKKKEPVTGLEVSAEGTRAEQHPRVFTDVNIEYIAYGNVNKESLDRAVSLSQEKYCNISITLKRAGVRVTFSTKIVDERISPSNGSK